MERRWVGLSAGYCYFHPQLLSYLMNSGESLVTHYSSARLGIRREKIRILWIIHLLAPDIASWGSFNYQLSGFDFVKMIGPMQCSTYVLEFGLKSALRWFIALAECFWNVANHFYQECQTGHKGHIDRAPPWEKRPGCMQSLMGGRVSVTARTKGRGWNSRTYGA